MDNNRTTDHAEQDGTSTMKRYESPALEVLGTIPDASRDDLYDISVIVG